MSRCGSRQRNRFAVVGVVLTLGGASVAGAAGLHFQHCGTLRGPGARFTILAHRARCQTARRVFGALFAGRGHDRRDPSTGQIDKVIDGWICGGGAGGFGCGKLGPGGAVEPYKPGQPSIDAEGQMGSPDAGVTKLPACTKQALTAGLRRGPFKMPGAHIEDFRCDGRWAFAVALDGVDDVPALFRAHGPRWYSVDRVKPCNEHAVPKKLYAEACLSS